MGRWLCDICNAPCSLTSPAPPCSSATVLKSAETHPLPSSDRTFSGLYLRERCCFRYMRCLLLWLITGSCFGIIFRLTKFTRVPAQFHTCAINSKRGLLCWGLNDNGQVFSYWACGFVQCDVCSPASLSGLLQLGDGFMSARLTPTPVSGLSLGVLVVSLGSRHSCAIDAAKVLYCWGLNTNGQVRQDVWMPPLRLLLCLRASSMLWSQPFCHRRSE
jgi:hypothetical protein